MASRTIPQAEWRAFFDGLADALVGKRVEVEAASRELGDQIVAEWLPLLGVTYEAQDDLLDVAMSGPAARNVRSSFVCKMPLTSPSRRMGNRVCPPASADAPKSHGNRHWS